MKFDESLVFTAANADKLKNRRYCRSHRRIL